jgi:hypothetical protein
LLAIILGFRENFNDSSRDIWADHYSVLTKQIVLVCGTKNVTTSYETAFLQIMLWLEKVESILIKRGDIHTTWNVHTLSKLCDCFQRSLDTIKNGLKDAYTPFIIKI